jgi:hypothetical protein
MQNRECRTNSGGPGRIIAPSPKRLWRGGDCHRRAAAAFHSAFFILHSADGDRQQKVIWKMPVQIGMNQGGRRLPNPGRRRLPDIQLGRKDV